MASSPVLNALHGRLTLLAGLGEVLSSGASTLLGIFSPPYFFQYIQQDTHRRHCMLGGPHEYHCADCMAVHLEREKEKKKRKKGGGGGGGH